MAGGGVIIIRNALKAALSDPLVRGMLLPYQRNQLDAFLSNDVSTWTEEQHDRALHCFNHAAHHC
jgi:hypothetical protein